jgi:para-nitrobenzyl esterase
MKVSPAALAPDDAMDEIVATTAGRIRGCASQGVARFLGIPYAAAPFGPHRFRAPVPPTPWEEIRDAVVFGPTAPKGGYAPPLDELLPDPAVPGSDCLNLNVWAPSPLRTGLPVVVWIHGGSFRNGSSAVSVYDGHSFVRDDVVMVSVNYRLGVEGFAVFPDAPSNRGLLDVIAGLEWVRENIAAFGGDPGKVTVFGESAAAIAIGALLVSPRATGLFRRAIMQSGPPIAVTPGAGWRDHSSHREAPANRAHRDRVRGGRPGHPAGHPDRGNQTGKPVDRWRRFRCGC